MSSSIIVISKIVAIFFLFCFTKAATGSCLSYGHSCWGGHGKRSGSSRHMVIPSPMQRRTNEWYISKLLKPSAEKPNELTALFKSQNQDNVAAEKRNPYGFQVYPIADAVDKVLSSEDRVDVDSENDIGEWGSDTNDSESELVVMTPEDQTLPNSRIRLLQIMNNPETIRKPTSG